MGGSSKKQTVGYKYYLGMHMILCHGPVDYLRRIEVDSKSAFTGVFTGGSLSINKPNLFGGEKREGGIVGTVDFETGGPTQTRNDYLQARLGSDIPAFRGVCGAVLRQVYLGVNPYLKRWAFRVQRVNVRQNGLEQWYKEKAPIGQLSAVALYFALDFSGSMHNEEVAPGVPRLDIEKEAMVEALQYIQGLIEGGFDEQIDIMLVAWGSYPSTRTSILRRNVDSSDIDDLISWVNSTNNQYETYFPSAVADAPSFFAGAGSLKRVILFLTDGEPGSFSVPNQQTIVDDALAITNTISNVEIYGINIGLENTFYTAQMDNTPDDGVPVVTDSDSGELVSAVLGAIVGHIDMNPAHIIRECLTDPDWGMGYQDSDIDDTSFTAAADTLHGEAMGISLLWDRQNTIEAFVQEIVKHIDAALYVDRTTGKFVLKLIRSDYDEGTLIELDESNISQIQNLQRASFGELTNSVTVNYWNSETGETASLTVQDTALAHMQQATINTTVQYPGFSNGIIAARAAARDLKALSTPLWTCTIFADKTADDLNIGDAFKLSWSDYGLSSVIMRATGMAFGNGKSNRVKLICSQDVFALPATPVVAVPDPDDGWQPIDETLAALAYRVVTEAPYYELVQILGQTAADSDLTANPDLGYILAAAGRPTVEGAINSLVYIDSGSGYEDSATMDFSPVALLDEDISEIQKTFAIKNLQDSDLIEVGKHCQIGNEICRIDSISSSSITIGRGTLDTLPEKHYTDDPIVFWDDYPASDETEYVASEVINVKLLPTSGAGVLDEADAPVDSVTMASRAYKPLPPGNLQINSDYFPEAIIGTLSLSWAHRDRLQQTAGALFDFEDGNIGPEAGTTYELKLYNEDGSLVRTETGLTGTTYTWVDELADSGTLPSDPYEDDVGFYLRFNGDQDSTDIVDSGPNDLTFNVNGGANIDQSQYVFGGSSLYLNGSGDSLTYGSPLIAATEDFTIEGWVRRAVKNERHEIYAQGTNQNGRFFVYFHESTNLLQVFIGSTGGNMFLISVTEPDANVWVNFAVVKQGTTHMLFINGVLEDTATTTQGIEQTSVYIGNSSSSNRDFYGWIDDLKLTNGVARYTEDYELPEIALNATIRMQLLSKRDGYESFNQYDLTIDRAGYGYHYGKYYGGV